MEEKLKWMFKLYDKVVIIILWFILLILFLTIIFYFLLSKDGNGEIDPEEMEDIFTKLCKAGQALKMYMKYMKEKKSPFKRKINRSTVAGVWLTGGR